MMLVFLRRLPSATEIESGSALARRMWEVGVA